MLRCVEREKSFITSRLDLIGQEKNRTFVNTTQNQIQKSEILLYK